MRPTEVLRVRWFVPARRALALAVVPMVLLGPPSWAARDEATGDGVPRAVAADVDTAGELDASFGSGGMVIAGCDVWDDDYFGCDGGYVGRLYDVVVQPDGRIVAAGTTEVDAVGTHAFELVRQLSDGRVDASFGGTGAVTTTFGAPSAAYALALQDDARIVVAGTAGRSVWPDSFYGGDGQPGNTFAVARYETDGTADASFDGDGKVRTRFGRSSSAAAYSVAIQPDGKSIVVGSAGTSFALARYGSDGALDLTFGSDGRIRTRILQGAVQGFASDVEVLDDGRVLVSGRACDANGCFLVLARYLSDGSLDPSFGAAGIELTPVSDGTAVDVVVQADGRIVAGAGHLLFRFDLDGAPDTSFSEDGGVHTNVAAAGVGVQSDGRIVVTGPTRELWIFEVARFEPDGVRDHEFGTAQAPFPGFECVAYAIAIQPDDKIVAVGTTSDVNIDGRFALARFLAS